MPQPPGLGALLSLVAENLQAPCSALPAGLFICGCNAPRSLSQRVVIHGIAISNEGDYHEFTQEGCGSACSNFDGGYAGCGLGCDRVRRGAFGLGCFEEERSEEHTSELQSLMRISYAVFG